MPVGIAPSAEGAMPLPGILRRSINFRSSGAVSSLMSRFDRGLCQHLCVNGVSTRPLPRSAVLLAKSNISFLSSGFLSGNSHLRQCTERRLGCRLLIRAVARETESVEFDVMPAEKKMIWTPIVQEGVFRFDANEGAKKQASPSLSFSEGQLRELPIEIPLVNGRPLETLFRAKNGDPVYIPKCRVEKESQITTLKLPSGTSFYGTGEASGTLERTGRRVFTWNTDAWGYGPSTTALYQSHPWVLAVLPDGSSLGVLADTTRQAEVDTRKEGTIRFVSSVPYPVITFGPYSAPEAVLISLSQAIGTVSMPPKWALGFQQCRWSYETAEIVQDIAMNFRERNLPCDVVWMDIDYMDGWRCFTFDSKSFPDPARLSNFLHEKGFKGVWMLDPGIKSEPGWSVYDAGSKEDVWVLTEKKKPYVGEVWPGPCVFPDFTKSSAREWWSELVKDFVKIGVDGIWNDMNEPAVFKVYGMLMARSTFEGMLLANPEKRPFVLTRAGFVGSQRYAATWTGDNLSNWVHLEMSIPMALNLSLSGQPLAGPDIGGFGGNATPKLFARWMGIGAMLPFSRAHSEKDTIDHEPWSFGRECEDICRLALNRRYRLLPHLYTLFYRSHMIGVPVMSPLFFSDPRDQRLRNVQNSFLLGPLLVAASTKSDMKINLKKLVLPTGIWQPFDFDDSHEDLPLLLLKGGSIIPTGPVVQHVGEMVWELPITLLVSLSENGEAVGVLYEDDGESFEFEEGKFLHTIYKAQFVPELSKVVVKVIGVDGTLSRPKRTLKVRVLVAKHPKIEGEGVDGEEVFVDLPSDFSMSHVTSGLLEEDVSEQDESSLAEDVAYETHESYAVPPTMLVDLKCGDWAMQVAPWIGGRIVSMIHAPTGVEWLEGKLERGAYEEYSGSEWRSPGCVEQYEVKKEFSDKEGTEGVLLEGDIGGGIVMCRHISSKADNPRAVQISSSIEARTVGAGSGGFSRLVCLRIHPSFKVSNCDLAVVKFTTISGEVREMHPVPGDTFLIGDERPNGEWVFLDKENSSAIVNRFKPEQVASCVVHWSPGICNLELWSEERPVSAQTPIQMTHEYEMWTEQQLSTNGY